MLLVSCILITFHNKRQYDQCPCGKTGRKLVSYPDPYVRNDDHRLQYDITYRGSGNKVVRNGSSATECCCTNQIAAICDVDIPMLWPSANCISSMPIVKPHPKSGVIEMRLGYSALRPNEYKAIKSILEGKDVFVTLPTGSGKSLCYAIFAFDDMYSHVNSIALIVSPLKALMNNQVSPLVATLMVI